MFYKSRIPAIGFGTLLVTLVTVTSSVIAQTPIAHWTFDDGINDYSITTEFDSAGFSDAVYFNPNGDGLSYVAGVVGGAAQLDGANGSDHYYNIDNIPGLDFAVEMSLTAWVKPASQGGYRGILMTRSLESSEGYNQNWGIARENNANFDGRLGGGGGLDSGSNIASDEWYHVALVWDSDDANFNVNPSRELYVNGQLVNDDVPFSESAFDIVASGSWYIGFDDCCANRQYGGGLDDLAVFNVALTASEVSTLYNNGIAGIDAQGNNTGVLLAGDVDGFNGVDIVDFEIIRDNFETSVLSRGLGDLNGDSFVDLNDFNEWYLNAPAAVSADISWTVPEPNSLFLLLVAALFASRWIPRQRCGKVACWVILTGMCTLLGAGDTMAQDVELVVNRDTNVLSISANTTGDIDGYAVLSDLGALNPTGWNSLEDQGLSDWREAGTASANFIAELKSVGTTNVASETVSLGMAFDPTAAKLAAGFSVDVEDLQFDHHSPSAGSIRNGTVTYVGEKIYNNLVVNVDTTTGVATLENESPFTVELNGYTIRSLGGFLNTGWTGLRDIDSSWQAANPTNTSLSELIPGGSLSLDPAASANLGIVYTGASDADQDLTFNFTLTSRLAPYSGILKYQGASGVTGDFNDDGAWDCDDINALTTAIANASADLAFDMNGDGAIDIGDITDADTGWLAVGGANNVAATGGNAFLNGDANLDGGVDVSDFNAWNSAKFTLNSNWCNGDFNADGSVDVPDFNIWNTAKFTSSASPAAVPEPPASMLLLLGLVVGIQGLRLRRDV